MAKPGPLIAAGAAIVIFILYKARPVMAFDGSLPNPLGGGGTGGGASGTDTVKAFSPTSGIGGTTIASVIPEQSFQKQQEMAFGQIGAIAGGATGAAVTAFLHGASAGPIGAAVGAAVAAVVILVGVLRGTAHLVSNQWVQNVQNPFGTALALVVDAKDRALRDGTATKAMVNYANQAVGVMWGKYKDAAETFAQRGKDYRTVINQSYQTLDKDSSGKGTLLITRIQADMTRQAAALP